jgi:hypothetical protein
MKLMAIFLASYMSLLSLAPNWQGIQFLKSEQLIAHYQEHILRVPNAGLFSFIQEHYFDRQTAQKEGHQNLPFKVNVGAQSIQLHLDEFKTPYYEIVSFIAHDFHEKNEVKPSQVATNDLFHIWQPPQLLG